MVHFLIFSFSSYYQRSKITDSYHRPNEYCDVWLISQTYLFFFQNGLPAVIEVSNVHNHSTESAAALLHLSARSDCRETFNGYFANGMGVAEAMKYHIGVLELDDAVTESQLADGSINPKQSTVRWWHDQWREHNLGPRTGNSLVKVYMNYFSSSLSLTIISASWGFTCCTEYFNWYLTYIFSVIYIYSCYSGSVLFISVLLLDSDTCKSLE